MEIGNTIRGLRQQRPGLSQKKLALELGYAQSTICDWENGAIEPSASAVKKLAVYFDVTAASAAKGISYTPSDAATSSPFRRTLSAGKHYDCDENQNKIQNPKKLFFHIVLLYLF